jgi:hypothetical protein
LNRLDERNILDRMKTLSRTEPPAEAMGRALGAARRRLVRAAAVRWAITGAIAAVVALAVGVGISTLAPRQATAAQAVVQAAENSTAYRGWVHTRTTEQAQGAAPSNALSVKHFNTATGAWAQEMHLPDGTLEVHMYLPDEKKEVVYTSRDKEVRLGDMSALFADGWRKEVANSPLTVAAAFAGNAGVVVRSRPEGKLLRYDYAFPNARAADEGPYPERCTVWADPESRLIQKVMTAFPGSTTTQEFSYGLPEIRDVYDLGVPRDARVVDLRLRGDVEAVVARLENKSNDGFGDYAAVETWVEVNDDGTQESSRASAWLYGRKGNKTVKAQFLFGDRRDARGRIDDVKPPRPAGWPAPELGTLLAAVEGRAPASFTATDGRTVWTGNEGRPSTGLNEGTILPHLVHRSLLSSTLWPDRGTLGLFGTDTKVELIGDVMRPGIVGVQIERLAFVGNRKGEQVQRKEWEIRWIDPAKDDLPVETHSRAYAPDGATLDTEWHSTYGDYLQTAGGQWYPSTATRVIRSRLPGGSERTATEKTHLRVFSGKTLDDAWFGDLAQRDPGSKR